MISTTYDFSSGAGFSYDAAKIDFIGGSAVLKDQRPANAKFYAAFASMLNANWAIGDTTVTAFNSAVIAGGVLDLTGTTNKYVTFSPVSNADFLQAGTIEMQVKPNYSGAPSSTRAF